jgi:amidase
MTIRAPSTAQLIKAGADLGLQLTEEDAAEYLECMAPLLEGYRVVDSLPDNLPPVTYPRGPGYFPEGEDNPYNAWYYKASIKGAASGKLARKKIAIKDNVCVAGIPMMNGSSILEGYVPDVDATIVSRILDAGGEIAGKVHCEYYCFSGGSHTVATGRPVQNPWKAGYSTGGSSSGSAAAVAAGDVPMAIGCDQAGSIRIPAAYSGICGMKPSYGLVPYTGIMAIEAAIDHAGPMTQTVADNALLLEVIAGADGLDPRQNAPRVAAYTEALTGEVKGMRIGVLKEGFGHANSEPDVDAKVRQSAELLRKLGAEVVEISIPLHKLSVQIWTPIGVEGTSQYMMHGNGFGTGWRGLYVNSLASAHSQWRHRAHEMSESLKYVILLGQHMMNCYQGRMYGKAMNLSRKLTAAYDAALENVDLLLMPTLPIKATPIPPPDAPRKLVVQRAHEMFPNTAAFDITPHPAMSVPCGLSDGLPIGMMLVGKQYDESSIYRAAFAFEQARDWKTN